MLNNVSFSIYLEIYLIYLYFYFICYLLIFTLLCYSIDATRETDFMGRMVNDGINVNSRMKKIMIGGRPHLTLFATKDIVAGSEIVYDYKDPTVWWRMVSVQLEYLPISVTILS